MNAMHRELAEMQKNIEGMNQESIESYQSHENEGELQEKNPLDVPFDPTLTEEEAKELLPSPEEKSKHEPSGEYKRIRELTKKNKLLIAENKRISDEATHLLQEKDRMLQDRDVRSLKMEEKNLNDHVLSAQKEWQWAYDNGDAAKLAEASTRLSYYTAQLVNVKDQQSYSQNSPPISYPTQRSPEPIEPDPPHYADQVQDWIDQNSWYDQSSHDFNPMLRRKIDKYASEVLNHYFSPEDPRYVDYLNDYISKETQNDSSPQMNSRQPQMKRSQQMVAPVNKSPMNGVKVNPVDKILNTLSEREKETALGLIYSDSKVNASSDLKLRKYAEGKLMNLQRMKQEQEARQYGGFSI